MAFKSDWQFYQDTKRQWHWRHLTKAGAIGKESKLGFGLKSQCKVDAKRHGFKDSHLKNARLAKGNYD